MLVVAENSQQKTLVEKQIQEPTILFPFLYSLEKFGLRNNIEAIQNSY